MQTPTKNKKIKTDVSEISAKEEGILCFRCEEELREAIKKAAHKENRSLSNWVKTLIICHLTDKGLF